MLKLKWAESKALMIASLVLIILAIVFLLLQMSPYMRLLISFIGDVSFPFLIAIIISYLLNPVVTWLSSKGITRGYAVILIYLVFILLLTSAIISMIPILDDQFYQILEYLPSWQSQINEWINSYKEKYTIPPSIIIGLEKFVINMDKNITYSLMNISETIGTTLNKMFIIFIIPFLSFYMMRDANYVEGSIVSAFPSDKRERIRKVVRDIDEALGNYVRGQLIVALIVGGMAFLGYKLIGLPFPFVLALAVSMFNVIPYLGPILGAIPAILVASTISIDKVFIVLAINLVVQMLEGNVISPNIIGKRLHMHPLLIIFAVLVGGEAAGAWGLILAVPIFAVIKVISSHILVYYGDR